MSVIGKCNKCGGPIYEGDTRCSNCNETFIIASKTAFPSPNPDPDPVQKSVQKSPTNRNGNSEREIRQNSQTEFRHDSDHNSDHNLSQNLNQYQDSNQNQSLNQSQNSDQPQNLNQFQNASMTNIKSFDKGSTLDKTRKIKYGIIAIGTLILTILITYLATLGKSSSYEVVIKDCTWQQAFDESKEAGGHLITLETEKEFRTVTELIDEHNLGDLRLYIAAARNDDSAEYYWIDANNDMNGKMLNGKSSFMYEKWEDDEPTFEGDKGGRVENRVVFVHKLKGYWRIKDVPDDMIGEEPDLSGMTGYIIEYD